MSPRIDRSALSPLKDSFLGRLLLPGDDGYETARRVHNGMIDRRPAIIACCLRTADVVNALEFAIRNELEITVRGGGHNVAGRAVIDDGMTIDLGSGALTSVRAVVQKIIELTDQRVQPVFGAHSDRPYEKVRVAETGLAYTTLRWKATTSINEGLARTVDWLRHQAKENRPV